MLAAGRQDIFKYIEDCAELGATQLDPWNAHLPQIQPDDALSDAEREYLDKIEEAADRSGLPWGCLVVDGAHIYEQSEDARSANRQRANKWLDVADRLGAEQIRIDAGGPEEMPADVFAVIKQGYEELIARAEPMGIEVLFENHWGPTVIPDNCLKLVDEIQGLSMLLDTHNWKQGLRDEGRRKCAPFARATHVKTLAWNGDEETGENAADAIEILKNAGYRGSWGVESVPPGGADEEIVAARKTIELIHRAVGE